MARKATDKDVHAYTEHAAAIVARIGCIVTLMRGLGVPYEEIASGEDPPKLSGVPRVAVQILGDLLRETGEMLASDAFSSRESEILNRLRLATPHPADLGTGKTYLSYCEASTFWGAAAVGMKIEKLRGSTATKKDSHKRSLANKIDLTVKIKAENLETESADLVSAMELLSRGLSSVARECLAPWQTVWMLLVKEAQRATHSVPRFATGGPDEAFAAFLQRMQPESATAAKLILNGLDNGQVASRTKKSAAAIRQLRSRLKRKGVVDS